MSPGCSWSPGWSGCARVCRGHPQDILTPQHCLVKHLCAFLHGRLHHSGSRACLISSIFVPLVLCRHVYRRQGRDCTVGHWVAVSGGQLHGASPTLQHFPGVAAQWTPPPVLATIALCSPGFLFSLSHLKPGPGLCSALSPRVPPSSCRTCPQSELLLKL